MIAICKKYDRIDKLFIPLPNMDTDILEIEGLRFVKAVSAEQLDMITSRLADRINQDYAGREVVFLVVLNGAFMFASDLLKKIEGVHTVCFIKVSTYSGMQSSGEYKEVIGLTQELKDRDVVIIEDIVDSGFTMKEMLERLKEQDARSVEVCTLAFKPDNFKGDYEVKYKGLNMGAEFIVGYGLDFEQKGRNLKEIYKKI